MKKIFLFIQLFFAFSCYQVSAQKKLSNDSLPKSVTRFKIKPSLTDSSIKVADSSHFVLYNQSAKQGKLLLFIPGTNGITEKGPNDFFVTAIQQGYRVISLSYCNTQAVSNTCTINELDKDANCAESFRIKRIYGTNTTSLITDEPQDAIMNRLTKLLIYLTKIDKQGNWEMYLQNGFPKWNKIAVSGQSQGGGMAAFIAKRELVARVITFSGGWDYAAKNKIAGWYFNKSQTPPERWYGIYNIAEPTATTIAETYKAMAILDNHIYPLQLEVRSGQKAHSEGIRNIAYKKQWIKILGMGN